MCKLSVNTLDDIVNCQFTVVKLINEIQFNLHQKTIKKTPIVHFVSLELIIVVSPKTKVRLVAN